MIKIAINGFGRIGRNVLRAIYERGLENEIRVVAINDLAALDTSIHLLKYDSTHGRFMHRVQETPTGFTVGKHSIQAYTEKDPSKLPWGDLDVDIVMECTGYFRTPELAQSHIDAGARKVLISAPGKGVEKTVVYGVNENILKQTDTIVSNASCTTNCLAHLAKAVEDSVGIEYGLVNTVHAYTNTQRLLDTSHKDKRRGRAAATSLIPTSTGSAKAIASVIPSLSGKLDAVAIRVPTQNVSLLDFSFVPTKPSSIDDVHAIFREYAKNRSGVFEVSDEPLVSIDYNHSPLSCAVDTLQTRQAGLMLKVFAWYDNEWGFSNRMIDTAFAMVHAE